METVLWVVVFYVLVFAGLRVLGKRQFGELSPFQLVTLLLIPELVQPAITREDYSAVNAAVAICTLLLLSLAFSLVAQRSERAEAVLEGNPTVLAYDGRLVPRALEAERTTASEVQTALRRAGLSRLEQVQWALLEPDGRISVIPRGRIGSPLEPLA